MARAVALLCLAAFWIPAAAFELLDSRWPEPAATFYVGIEYTDGISPSGKTWDQAFREAGQSWASGTRFRYGFVDQRSDPCAGVVAGIPEDGSRSGVGFFPTDCGIPFGATTLAVTTTYFSGSTTDETDIVFNSREAWDVYGGPLRFGVSDFRRVAAHELGHALGLAHEDGEFALMRSLIGDIEVPTADDRAGVAALYGPPAPDALQPIRVWLEEPAAGEAKTGVANLRGWAVSTAGIERLELYLDGVYTGNVPYGGSRSDIGATFPDYPNSGESGFSQAFNYSLLSAGNHDVRVRAIDREGRSREASASFTVVRLADSFVPDADAVDYGSAVVDRVGQTIRVRNVAIDGVRYDLSLEWRTATQDYQVVDIRRLD